MALVALGELDAELVEPVIHPVVEAVFSVDIHCKAFVIGFVSTVFTILPFILGYAGKNQLSLDPSSVVVGIAKVGSLGGLCYIIANRGNPAAREEFEKVYDFIHPYMPMILGSMGRGSYEPVFQELQKQVGSQATHTTTPPFQGYTSGYSSGYSSTRPSPANPPRFPAEKSWLAGNNKTPNLPSRVIETPTPTKVVHEPQLIQVKETDIGRTVCLTAWHPPSDPKTVEVDIDDMDPIEELDAKQRSKQDNFEFDRDALYEFDNP